MKSSDYSEDALVEQPTIELFKELGWETANCFREFESGRSPLGRESKGDVVLVQRLRTALEKLNPSRNAASLILASNANLFSQKRGFSGSG